MFDREQLISWRTSRGLSQIEMSKLLGVKRETITDWETGKYKPKKCKLETLHRFMADYDAGKIQIEKEPQDRTRACRGCIYLGEWVKSCDYMLITGKRRPCPPGEGCTVKHVGKKSHTRPFEMRAPATRFNRMIPATERDPRIRELYDAGKSDAEISRETGHSISAIYNWRHRHSLPTNYNHNKGIKTGKHKRKKGET